MDEHQVNAETTNLQAPPSLDENLEKKPQAPSPLSELWEYETKELGDKAEDNLFKIQALARVIIEKSAYVYNKRFACSKADAEDFGDDEEITFLNDLDRFAEMIIEKVEQINRGVFA